MSASKRRRALATLGVLAIAIPAAGLAGCGDDTQDSAEEAFDQAQEEVDQATEDVQEQAEELQQDIEEQADEVQSEIEEQADEATEDETTTNDSGGVYAP
jgi:Skp family chaperone for outer membrane proteins